MIDEPDIDISRPYSNGRKVAECGNYERNFEPDPLPERLIDGPWTIINIERLLTVDFWELVYRTQRAQVAEFWFRAGYNSRLNEFLGRDK